MGIRLEVVEGTDENPFTAVVDDWLGWFAEDPRTRTDWGEDYARLALAQATKQYIRCQKLRDPS